MRYDPMMTILSAIRGGSPIVVIDDNHSGSAVLVLAASVCGPDQLAFTIRHGSGYVRAALTDQESDRLHLPSLREASSSDDRPAFCVSVDAKTDTTTGISARDRARTIRLLASPGAQHDDFTRPGHVIPERVGSDGVLGKAGFPESAVDLARLAGLGPAAAYSELTSSEDGRHLANAVDAMAFARKHGLSMISIGEIVRHRELFDVTIERIDTEELTTAHGQFVAHRFIIEPSSEQIMCLTVGLNDGERLADVPISVHVECMEFCRFPGVGCDCAKHLADSMKQVAIGGRGAIVFACRPKAEAHASSQMFPPFVTSSASELAHQRATKACDLLSEQIGSGCGPAHLILRSLGIESVALPENAATHQLGPRSAVLSSS